MFEYNFIGSLKNIYKNLLTTKQHCVTIKLQTKQQQVFVQKILFKKNKKVVDKKIVTSYNINKSRS